MRAGEPLSNGNRMIYWYGPAGFGGLSFTRFQGGARIGVPRHSGGSRFGGARLVLVACFALLAFGGGPLAASVAAAQQTATADSPATKAAPKVVPIVGAGGGATPYYRRLADEAAAAAVKLTPNVVKVYSPDATWTNVKAALQGASVVVYLGHGNGWPSIYRDALYPLTQNGFGLNPHEGAADSHQYFGEQQIGSGIKLAPDAVVIFSHLCYASGNTQPGLAEGTLAQAEQRGDNYAAGVFRAGAGAGIPGADLAPAYYLKAVLRGSHSIDSIWKNAPNRNDHFLRFPSKRTKGAIAKMDPDNVDSGFHRSIVLKAKLTSREVIGNAVRGPQIPIVPVEPTLADRGLTFGAPDLTTPPTVGAATTLTLPVAGDAIALLPARLMVGTRWDRLDGGAPASPRSAAPAPVATAARTAGATLAGHAPGTTAPNDPTIDLVVPEPAGAGV